MFVIQEEINETIDWPVIVEVPVTGGKNRKYEFTGTFNRLNDEQKDALTDTKQSDVSGEWLDGYLDRTMEIMVDWKGVVTPQKEPIGYSRETLRKAVMAPSGLAVINAIARAMHQIEAGAKAKN
jgi:hypothetical protein